MISKTPIKCFISIKAPNIFQIKIVPLYGTINGAPSIIMAKIRNH